MRRLTLTPTQRTSLLVAAFRDLEQRLSARPLLSDPQAPHLLNALATPDEVDAMFNHPLASQGGVDILAVRTRLLDSWLEQPTWPPLRTTRRQTVLLGAGMDARAYRMGFSPHSHVVFEVDADKAVLEAKHATLQQAGFTPRCAVRLVEADVGNTTALEAGLIDAGFDVRLPTRWMAEGLLEYLPRHTHEPLLALTHRMGGSAGSGIAAQILEPSFGDHVVDVLTRASGGNTPAALPYQPLGSLSEALAAMRAAGWTGVRAMRQQEVAEVTGRHTHAGFHLIFAQADPLTAV